MVAYFHVDLVMSRRLVLGVPILPGGCWDRLEPPRVKGVVEGWSRE